MAGMLVLFGFDIVLNFFKLFLFVYIITDPIDLGIIFTFIIESASYLNSGLIILEVYSFLIVISLRKELTQKIANRHLNLTALREESANENHF